MPSLSAIRAEVPGIVGLAVPIIAALAASSLIGITDSLMLAPLGPVPLAAVGLTNAAAIIVYATIYGVLSAQSVRIGTAWGARRQRDMAGLLRSGLVLGALTGLAGAVVMGALWFALPLFGQPAEVLAAMPVYYAWISAMMVPFAILFVFTSTLEAMGRPWLGTGFAFVAVIVNVPLNYALIWGIGPFPELGLTGAGVASFASQVVALAVGWLVWARLRSLRRLRIRRQPSMAEVAATFREGAPLGLMYLAETAAVAVATFLIGTFGTIALAANQVAMSVGGLIYMVPLGVAGAVAIRVAQEVGAENRAALRPVALAALAVATLWLSAAAVLLLLGANWLSAAIVDEPEVVTLAATIMVVFGFMQVFDGLQSTMVGALRGMSDAGWAAMISMIAYWPVGLPLGWAFAHWWGYGAAGVWVGWLIALAWAGAMLTGRFLVKTRAGQVREGTT
jgi:MATE family multidrug resistance protein